MASRRNRRTRLTAFTATAVCLLGPVVIPSSAHATPTGAGVDCEVFDDPMTCYAGGDRVGGGTPTGPGPTPFSDCLNSYFDSSNSTIVHDGDIAGTFRGYDPYTGFALIQLSGKYNNNACANDLVSTASGWVYWLKDPVVQARNDNGNVRVEVGFF